MTPERHGHATHTTQGDTFCPPAFFAFPTRLDFEYISRKVDMNETCDKLNEMNRKLEEACADRDFWIKRASANDTSALKSENEQLRQDKAILAAKVGGRDSEVCRLRHELDDSREYANEYNTLLWKAYHIVNPGNHIVKDGIGTEVVNLVKVLWEDKKHLAKKLDTQAKNMEVYMRSSREQDRTIRSQSKTIDGQNLEILARENEVEVLQKKLRKEKAINEEHLKLHRNQAQTITKLERDLTLLREELRLNQQPFNEIWITLGKLKDGERFQRFKGDVTWMKCSQPAGSTLVPACDIYHAESAAFPESLKVYKVSP